MERVNKICSHPLWKDSLKKIRELEQNRVFCCHTMEHFLDVARIAYIENLEKNLHLSKELIYGAALLHDIGRHLEYTQGIPHEQGSVQIAEEILKDCSFEKEEQEEILSAIQAHRIQETGFSNDLAGIVYRADKKSRNCAFCHALQECNWDREKKNLVITV